MIAEKLGKYELRGQIGRGAMGVVHRAYDTVLEREVALRTMAGRRGDEKEDTLRFLREARAAGGLHHPNIVTIHELGYEDGAYFIAMELMEGTDLEKVIKSGDLPPLARRLRIVARLCSGLDFAHRAGIVHRDVKPANVFLCSDGAVKILDFGVAKIASSDATRTGMVIGTVDYMSPEQIRADKNLDGRSDIFSAGVILYELLFGRKPFAADHLGAILHRVLHEEPLALGFADTLLPPALMRVLRSALDKRREARFQTAGEMASALDEIAPELEGERGEAVEARISDLAEQGAFDDPAKAAEHAGATRVLTVEAALETTERPRRLGPAMVLASLAVLGATVGWWLFPGREVDTPPSVTAVERARVVPPAAEPVVVAEEPPGGSAAVAPEPVPGATEQPTEVEKASAGPARDEAAPSAPPATLPVARPVVRRPGELVAIVMPWARLVTIEDLETGERLERRAETPVRLSLPEGRYRLEFDNPHASGPLSAEVTVRAGETRWLRRTMPGYDAGALARELSALDGRTRRTP